MNTELLNNKKLSATEFYEIFKPYGENDELIIYETYGDDVESLKERAKKFAFEQGTKLYQHIWTVIDGDGFTFASNGWHLCNRTNYLVCETPWGNGTESDKDVFIEAEY